VSAADLRSQSRQQVSRLRRPLGTPTRDRLAWSAWV